MCYQVEYNYGSNFWPPVGNALKIDETNNEINNFDDSSELLGIATKEHDLRMQQGSCHPVLRLPRQQQNDAPPLDLIYDIRILDESGNECNNDIAYLKCQNRADYSFGNEVPINFYTKENPLPLLNSTTEEFLISWDEEKFNPNIKYKVICTSVRVNKALLKYVSHHTLITVSSDLDCTLVIYMENGELEFMQKFWHRKRNYCTGPKRTMRSYPDGVFSYFRECDEPICIYNESVRVIERYWQNSKLYKPLGR